ncbi:hypothetical protein CALCODRAFT_484363 [Calocera cornea HHB12733]|uniref:Uncharacterized protein n=1 Tax=Calocera cornea HHB12733 TaxID=1353952 RepID=A0A165F0I8_9BASI|nr:hypothetical protein CALCODRAFT_484363 [Calocera cornea HHB12733]
MPVIRHFVATLRQMMLLSFPSLGLGSLALLVKPRTALLIMADQASQAYGQTPERREDRSDEVEVDCLLDIRQAGGHRSRTLTHEMRLDDEEDDEVERELQLMRKEKKEDDEGVTQMTEDMGDISVRTNWTVVEEAPVYNLSTILRQLSMN